jgi:hypothetical protein
MAVLQRVDVHKINAALVACAVLVEYALHPTLGYLHMLCIPPRVAKATWVELRETLSLPGRNGKEN